MKKGKNQPPSFNHCCKEKTPPTLSHSCLPLPTHMYKCTYTARHLPSPSLCLSERHLIVRDVVWFRVGFMVDDGAGFELGGQVLFDGDRDAGEEGGVPLQLDQPLAQHLADGHDVTAASLHVNLLPEHTQHRGEGDRECQ